MKSLKTTIGTIILSGGLFLPGFAFSADSGGADRAKNAKPYTLTTCIVSGEKLDGDMGKPYVFAYQGQEFKLCCKSCLKDFNKEPAKYLKKLAEAQKGGKGKTPPNVPAQDHSGHGSH